MTDYQNGQFFYIYGWTEWVDRDTLMPNGKKYSVIVSDGHTGGLYRQEGTKVVNPGASDTEFVRYDFSKTIGDTIWSIPAKFDTIYFYIIDDFMTPYYGQLRRVQIYYQKGSFGTEGIQYHVIDGFGVVMYEYEPGEIWNLRGAIINGIKYGTITSVNDRFTAPTSYSLEQNYPNPFNPSTTFAFSIPKGENVSLRVFDVLGREVAMVTNRFFPVGRNSVVWDALNISSGLYFYTFQSGSYIQTKKLTILR